MMPLFAAALLFLPGTQASASVLDAVTLAIPVLRTLTPHEFELTPVERTRYYHRCQDLFAAGKEQEALNLAAVTMQKFIAARDNTEGLVLGFFETGKHLIYVVYNMGPRERAKNRMSFPYSFHVYTLDAPPEFLRRIDWEIAYSPASQPVSSAVGAMVGNTHVNYGGPDVDADFATVKAHVLAILEKEKIDAVTILGDPNDQKFQQHQEFMRRAYPRVEYLLGIQPRDKTAAQPPAKKNDAPPQPQTLPPEAAW